ncbi:TadE/TadG family type IV pilus assembly protein [Kluyvera sichuanensis]|uniref:TadE/TadG family type IV pilus assembly protein n=1 Tax=Kluyvera sichuanensis TaxID=2725494 RepID=UPI0039F6CE3D
MKNIISLCKTFLIMNKGTIAVATAIMFPSLLGFYSIAIDGSRFNSDRARLNDAINNSVYALAVVDNRNETLEAKTVNNQLANNYISYYFPKETINADNVTVNATTVFDENNEPIAVDYQVVANKISHPVFDFNKTDNNIGFDKNVTINGNGISGTARRTTAVPKAGATDYVFVVDFSTSMTYASAQAGYTREKLLKSVVRRLGEQVFELNNGSTIGIVPYSIGVPARLDKTNYASASSKEVGCTYAGKMKGGYDTLDWSFWYNKPSGNFAGENASVSTFITKTDKVLRDYYVDTIAKSNGYENTTKKPAANNWLIDKGYCYANAEGVLICDADQKSSIHNSKNQRELEKNLQNFLDVSDDEYHQYGIINEKTMDIDGTLSGDYLFNEDNVKTLVNFQNGLTDIPFYWSCADAYDDKYAHKTTMYKKIKEIEKPAYYLLNLTDDSSVFDEFDSMYPQGYTESLSGLLRSVPLLAKGKNPRKYIFVISDGNDSHETFRRKLMTNYDLCGVIKDGLKKYPEDRKATESDIFYISLVKNTTTKEWADECVGSANSFVATNLNQLIETLSSIMFKNTIEYINPAEVSDESSSEENYSDKD